MQRLAYVSAPSVPVGDVILDIVRVSERLNVECGVSGLLLYGELRYFQVLEGENDAVSATLGRIRADLRHRILWEAAFETDRRIVAPDLPMGYLSDGEIARLGGGRSASALAAPRRSAASDAVTTLLAIGGRKYPSTIHPAAGTD